MTGRSKPPALADRLVIGGSDDPLPAYAIGLFAGELGAEAIIAYCPGGTRRGLAQLAKRRAPLFLRALGRPRITQVRQFARRLRSRAVGHAAHSDQRIAELEAA